MLLRLCGSKFKIYCNGNTFFLRINNINVIVYGMKQHCDIKIKFCTNNEPGSIGLNS